MVGGAPPVVAPGGAATAEGVNKPLPGPRPSSKDPQTVGAPFTVLAALGSHHQGSMGPRHGEIRSPSRDRADSSGSRTKGNQARQGRRAGARVVGTVQAVADHGSSSKGGVIEFQADCWEPGDGDEEEEAVCQSGPAERLSSKDANGHGEHQGREAQTEKGSLAAAGRPLEILLDAGHSPRPPVLLPVQDRRGTSTMGLPPFRLQERHADHAAIDESGDRAHAHMGHRSDHLGGRHDLSAHEGQEGVGGVGREGPSSVDGFGLHSEPAKNGESALPASDLQGFCLVDGEDASLGPRGQTGGHSVVCQQDQSQTAVNEIPSLSGGQGEIYSSSPHTCSSVDCRARDREGGESPIRGMGGLSSGDSRGGQRDSALESSFTPYEDAAGSDSRVRDSGGCWSPGVRILRPPGGGGALVGGDLRREHQLQGTSDLEAPSGGLYEYSASHGDPVWDGLERGSVLHQEDLRQVPHSLKDGGGDLEADGAREDNSNSLHQNSRGDSQGGLSLTSQGQERHYNFQLGIQTHMPRVESVSDNRLVRDEVLGQDPQILHSQGRSRGVGSQCFLNQLAGRGGVCLPSREPNRQNPTQHRDGGLQSFGHSPGSSISQMEASHQETSSQIDIDLSRGSEDSTKLFGKPQRLASISDPEQFIGASGLTDDAARTIRASLADSTIRIRKKYCSNFETYLRARGIDVFDSRDIMNFLSTVNPNSYATAKTAICTTIFRNTGVNFSENPLLAIHARGSRNQNPKEGYKYEDMWNAQVLIDFLRTYDANSLKRLRAKTFALVRLSIAGRNGDVTHIDRHSILWGEDYVSFKMFRHKTLRFQTSAQRLVLRKVKDYRVCPYYHFHMYMLVYRDAHASLRYDERRLWMSMRTPVVPVGPPTLAGDVKELMLAAGVPSEYGPHTIRHAAITYWRENNVSLEGVIERTGHKSTRLVSQFYDRAKISKDWMAEILNARGESDHEEEWESLE